MSIRDQTAFMHTANQRINGEKMRRRRRRQQTKLICKNMRPQKFVPRNTFTLANVIRHMGHTRNSITFVINKYKYMSFICSRVLRTYARFCLCQASGDNGICVNILYINCMFYTCRCVCMWDNTFCLNSVLHTK